MKFVHIFKIFCTQRDYVIFLYIVIIIIITHLQDSKITLEYKNIKKSDWKETGIKIHKNNNN